MDECLECGSRKKLILHPEYSDGLYGDKLCPECLVTYWEEELERVEEELEDARNATL